MQELNHYSIENIIDYALSKPGNFPGKQNCSSVRTNPNQKPVEPKSQVSNINGRFEMKKAAPEQASLSSNSRTLSFLIETHDNTEYN